MEVISVKKKWRQLLICLAIPLGVGALAGWLTRGSMAAFARLTKPPLSPPGWVFPVVWTILFLMMGLTSWLVLRSGEPPQAIREALRLYALQLAVNFYWSILFFNRGLYLFAFVWLVLLWVLVLFTAIRFYRISKPAGALMLPYLLWITFAGYLNLAIYLLN